ncbi:hypothetical protein VME_49080 [Vibrio harveyi 1DA3]|nr:hypothetical protein VME_49080 [Vibrio harveyi 1DA3]
MRRYMHKYGDTMTNKRTSSDWYKFQEDIRNHFESLGTYARTNVAVSGVRGDHDIDVLVKSKFLGSDITWVIEAKKWKTNVPKEKVLALQTIVHDIGADRGFIISEKGFQSGAIKAAENSNISLVNFEQLLVSTREFMDLEILKHYEERYEMLSARYSAHPKHIRVDYNLKHDICPPLSPFSGATLLGYIRDVIASIKSRNYPINTDTGLQIQTGEKCIADFHQACNWLHLNLNLMDKQLLKAEYLMMKYNDFRPNYERWGIKTT